MSLRRREARVSIAVFRDSKEQGEDCSSRVLATNALRLKTLSFGLSDGSGGEEHTCMHTLRVDEEQWGFEIEFPFALQQTA